MSLSDNMRTLEIKIAALKKGVIEERKKNQLQQNEINSLNDKIAEKNEIISKLQDELKTQNSSLANKDPKQYYNNLMTQVVTPSELSKEKEENEKEIKKLKEKITDLQAESESFQEQTMALKENLESLTEDIDKTKNEYEESIRKTKQEYEEKICLMQKEIDDKTMIIKENEEKVKVIQNLYIDFDNMKVSYEKQIKELKFDNGKKTDTIIDLNVQIEALMSTVQQLKQDIEKKSSECLKLRKELENKIEITRDYLFTGKLILKGDEEVEKKKNKITIYFGKFDSAVVFCYDNTDKIIPIMQINYCKLLDNVQMNNVITINFNDDNNVNNDFICQFHPRECEYIVRFYEEMEEKSKKQNDKMLKFAFSDFFPG